MKSRILLLIPALFFTLALSAVPALRRWMTMTQSDGTAKTVMLVGDERSHYYIDRDGAKWLLDSAGMFVPLSEERARQITVGGKSSMQKKQLPRLRSAVKRSAGAYSGSRRGLIILVEFQDRRFTISNPKAEYESLANRRGYTNSYGATGSVRDYFLSQSYGTFDMQFDVVGPVRLENSMIYYGRNGSSSSEKDIYAGRMIAEACRAATDSVDISKYDWDGDSIVDQVYIVYAGYGEATGGSEYTVWPHEYDLYSAAYDDDNGDFFGLFGRRQSSAGGPGGHFGHGGQASSDIYDYGVEQNGYIFNTYACGNELVNMSVFGGTGNYMMGIGVICHEFSHCMGLPDLYDTVGSGYGLGNYDIMSKGSYNGQNGIGECPAGYSAYERMVAGWLSPQELTRARQVTAMQPLNVAAEAYVIYNPAHRDEYYLLENRDKTGWDSYLPDNGLLVAHVDYDSCIWSYNVVNSVNGTYYVGDESRTNTYDRLTILRADNSDPNSIYATDESTFLYPYKGLLGDVNDSISEYSSPAFTLNNKNTDGGSVLHCVVNSIKQHTDGTLSFSFFPDRITAGISSAVLTDGNGTAVYNLQGRRVAADEPLAPGVYIIRKADGTSVKKVVK